MTFPQTVGDALSLAREKLHDKTSTPNLEAQLLLMKATGQARSWVLAHAEARLEREQAGGFLEDLSQVEAGVPLPYVLGWWEFFGRKFRVTPEVMIPRPETELLVDRAMRALQQRGGSGRALDLGTGSGCIAVSLAAEWPELRLVASDISRRALAVCRFNARHYGVDHQLALVQADLQTAFRGRFDLICANLPYIPRASLEGLAVAGREPRIALDGGGDGLKLIRSALGQLPRVLSPGGLALFEIEAEHGSAAVALAAQSLARMSFALEQDLAGNDRLLIVEANG